MEEKDALSYQALRLKSYQESPYAFSESYEDEKERNLSDFLQEIKIEGNPPEQFILGIFNEGKELVGFVKFRRDKRSKARHKSMIHAMYIKHEYRNQQLGKMLIDDLIQRVKQLEGLEQYTYGFCTSKKAPQSFIQDVVSSLKALLLKRISKLETTMWMQNIW